MQDKELKNFNKKVRKTNDGCWLWTGSYKGNGYGSFGYKRKTVRAHRFSWMVYNGPIPTGINVLHSCDNRKCVNPAHLFLGTQKDNIRDMFLKGREGKHIRNSSLRKQLLTRKQIEYIKRVYSFRSENFNSKKLSKELNISTFTFFKYLRSK